MSNKQSANPQNRRMLLVSLMITAAVVIVTGLTLLLPRPGHAPEKIPSAEEANAAREDLVEEGAILFQTLTYTRCEHQVARRVTAPTELYGKNLAGVEALYPEWQITEFSPSQIRMAQQPDIFCPDHLVLMPDATGRLCVFQNKYGDALALVSELETDVSTLPAALQEELAEGIGFPNAEELDKWLESAES
ncbi:MAG: hypothetical protein J6K72_04095 [Clostridia bacterium]|nr:hypothetical protein [Clostridia bacterium]